MLLSPVKVLIAIVNQLALARTRASLRTVTERDIEGVSRTSCDVGELSSLLACRIVSGVACGRVRTSPGGADSMKEESAELLCAIVRVNCSKKRRRKWGWV
jgi:hypothetical protein